MRTTHSAARTVLGSADLAALALLRPHPATLIADLAAPHAWIERVGVDAALATLAGAALWVAALWLAVGLAAALAARLPGVAGQCSARMCEALLPRALRGVVAGSAGLGILLTPAAALAAHGPAGRAVAADTVPAPAWPVDLGANPAAPAATLPSPARTESSATGPVTVRPGDSLWLIAARSLGPRPTDEQVAAAWPRWFAANRSVIGPDPGLIRPGQTLHPPTPTDAPPTNSKDARP